MNAEGTLHDIGLRGMAPFGVALRIDKHHLKIVSMGELADECVSDTGGRTGRCQLHTSLSCVHPAMIARLYVSMVKRAYFMKDAGRVVVL